MTDQLTRVDSIFLRLNLLLLMVVAFLPFPTRLAASALGHTSSERVFVTMYGLALVALRLLGLALDAYAKRERLYSQERVDEDLGRDRRKLLPVVVGYVIAILIGLPFPFVAMVLYLAIAVYLVVPFREVRRLLWGRT
jgi:TMEM175 potassium channel family protein